ncbi:MAG: J domain-containing protein [Pseudomonadota bacterium]
MKTPFDILGVPDDATDEVIKKAYLQRVRQYPPERAPEQFQKIRGAFEAIQTRDQRLKYQLFHHEPPNLGALLERVLQTTTSKPQRTSEQLFTQVLADRVRR